MYLTHGRQNLLTLHINGGAVIPQGKHSLQAKFARTNVPVLRKKIYSKCKINCTFYWIDDNNYDRYFFTKQFKKKIKSYILLLKKKLKYLRRRLGLLNLHYRLKREKEKKTLHCSCLLYKQHHVWLLFAILSNILYKIKYKTMFRPIKT